MTGSPSRLDERPGLRGSAAAQSGDAYAITRIAVGVDEYPEGRDAAALGAALAGVTGADLLLATVHSPPLVPLPPAMDWKSLRADSQLRLRDVRDRLAPEARIVTETDLSVARGLHRVIQHHHRDLVVLGSSRQARDGRVRIGKRTRQLLCNFECALAVAPRGMQARPEYNLRRIAVGYDGGPESESALRLASSIAKAAGAELEVCTVVDDRIRGIAAHRGIAEDWGNVIDQEMNRARGWTVAAARDTGADGDVEVLRGRPANALLALSERVDLLVIGSRRWGPAKRVLLGSTGESLMHDAACPVLAVPRPTESVKTQ